MRACFMFLIAALVAAVCVAEPRQTLVGRVVPPLPDGCESDEEGLVGGGSKLAYTHLTCKDEQMVVLETFVERRDELAYFRVVDELQLPPMQPGYEVLPTVFCEWTADRISRVFAIGRWKKNSDGSYDAEISHAWQFSLQHEKIEPIPPAEVICSREDAD